MILMQDYFYKMQQLGTEPSFEVKSNAEVLLLRVNNLMLNSLVLSAGMEAVTDWKVSSGWRSAAHNATIPTAAVRSRHITGEAIDLADPEGELDEFLFNNQDLLRAYGLYMEHPLATKGWCHLQCSPTRSGNRVFFP